MELWCYEPKNYYRLLFRKGRGKHYDWLFDNRHKADYRPLVQFDADQVKEIVEESEAFVKEMAGLINNQKSNGKEI